MAAPHYQPVHLTTTLAIQRPLTRKGDPGPGLLIIQDAIEPIPRPTLDPEPLQKWAEEGYFVARIEVSESQPLGSYELLLALEAFEVHDTCAGGASSFGIITYSKSATRDLIPFIDAGTAGHAKAVVSYGPLPDLAQPQLCHLAENGVKSASVYCYPEARSASFALPSHPDYLPASAAVAHSRTLDFLKQQLGGPWFDLEAVWEEHTRLEFADRAVEETMDTMVDEPYVNHVPTMTGGIGRKNLTSFYAKHFIFSNPDDTELQLISRTIGIDRVVDEFIFSLTHDRVIDWL